MSNERSYSEEEVAAIFEHATRLIRSSGPDSSSEAHGGGMSLVEIQKIGAEVGISADLIARSAHALDLSRSEAAISRRFLNIPVAVEGDQELPRELTDVEWDTLVAEIRYLFEAHGTVEETRNLRSWRNGNLRVQLEPTPQGQRIRMQTFRQASAQLMGLGTALAGGGTALGLLISLMAGNPMAGLEPGVPLVMFGVAVFLSGALRTGRWAEERSQQMKAVMNRALQLSGRVSEGSETPDQLSPEDRTDPAI